MSTQPNQQKEKEVKEEGIQVTKTDLIKVEVIEAEIKARKLVAAIVIRKMANLVKELDL
jgi:hypothetical protein